MKSIVLSKVSMNGLTHSATGTVHRCSVSGYYSKPRPALVIQSNLFADLPSVVECPLTATLRENAGLFRLDVIPSSVNGLHRPSQLAVDKITAVPLSQVGAVLGKADDALLLQVNRALVVFLSIV